MTNWCDKCNGSGRVFTVSAWFSCFMRDCPSCDGRGIAKPPRTKLVIPPAPPPRMRVLAAPLWLIPLLLLATPLLAAPPSLEIPAEVRPSGQYVRLLPKTDAEGVAYIGLSGLDPFPSEELEEKRKFILDTRGLAVGRYKFAAIAWSGADRTRFDFDVVVGEPPPGPGPEPPKPEPPGPQPDPNAPLKVLILYDKQAPNDGWQDVLGSREVEDYLNAKCGKDGFYSFDDKPTFTNLPQAWKEIHGECVKSFKDKPRVYFIRGTAIKAADLPDTVPAAMALLKQFGG